MNYTAAVAVAGALALSACDAKPTEPDAAPEIRPSLVVRDNTREPVDATAVSDCGEDVQMSGTIHRFGGFTRDGSGGLHYKGHITWTGLKGIGLETGRQYVGFQGDDISLEMPAGTFTVTERLRGVLVGLGDAPNLVLKSLYHVTFDPNDPDTPTSFISNFEIDCH